MVSLESFFGWQADTVDKTCEEIRAGQHHTQIVIDCMEGSDGTSINMNANEVVGNRALQLFGHTAGDHVHLSQKTI